MKTIFVALFGLILFSSCSKNDNGLANEAQTISESAVPAAVRTAFNNSFPAATETEWQRVNNEISCQFNRSSSRDEARFDDNGQQRSHRSISTAAIPAVVLQAFRTQFANDVVYEWKLRSDGNWKAHFMRGSVKWEVTITPAGTIIKVEHY
jgi:hypothetical protein